MKLKNKLGGLCFFIIVFYVSYIAAYFLPTYKAILLKQKEIQLESTATQLNTMIKTLHERNYTRDEIIKIIKGIRYGTDGREYVLLLNNVGFCVQHPTTPELDNNDVSKVKDAHGFPLVQEYLRIANTGQGKGIISYHWPWFNDKQRIEPKMAYVYNYPALDLVVIATAYVNDVETYINHLTNVSVFATGLVSFIVIVLSIIIIKNVLKSITNLKVRLQELNDDSDGTLSKNIPVSRDELGEVAYVFNVFLLKIRSIITTTMGVNHQLEVKTNELSSLITRFNDIASYGSQTVDCMGTEFSSLSHALTGLNSGINKNSEQVKHVSVASMELTNIVTEISKQTSNTQVLATTMKDRMNDISNSLQVLLTNNNRIDEVIETITKMAKQTSMLALNARIEAAKVAEAGKGFAVVASEISDLSNESTESALHINDIVAETKQQTVSTISSIRTVFEGIAEIITNIVSIAAAIEEQSISSMEISKNILTIDTSMIMMQEQSNHIGHNASNIKTEVDKVEEHFVHIRTLKDQLIENVGELTIVKDQISATLRRFKV